MARTRITPGGTGAALGAALAVALLAAAAPDEGHGRYPDRAPPAHTGGFGEPSCRQCHFDGEPEAPDGQLTVAGVPEVYRPGGTYRVTVRVAKPEMLVGGFQLAARFAEGPLRGKQAGSLRALDGRAQVVVDSASGVQYASHTKPGTEQTAHWAAEWALEWTAPAEASGPVVFHAAANAANGDESQLGDFVYLKELATRMTPASP